ncbi:MAG: hypothetical protein LBE12_09620 [Planctomycetaceae bacterium]|jgi:hypothetical protein|nr:hypothetical protein [Planctomycetaceae bacterium]
MTVSINNGNINDHTVGFVAASKHQTGWGFLGWRHHPHLPLLAPIPLIIQQQIGYDSTRWNRTPLLQQFTGHTAIMSRVAGNVNFVRGFSPDGILRSFAMLFGCSVAGVWHNDIPMLGDPTCISYEIPVTNIFAQNFDAWSLQRSLQLNTYSLRTSDGLNSFNCVIASITMLVNYLMTNGLYHNYAIRIAENLQGSRQGDLIQRVLDGSFL